MSAIPNLKPPVRNVYQIGKATVEKRGGKMRMMELDENAEEIEPPKIYQHKPHASKIVDEVSGNEYLVLSRVALIRSHSRKVEGDPDAENPRLRQTHHRFVPEDNVIHVTLTDGKTVWKGCIKYELHNLKRVRAGGRDDTWKKDFFLTLVSETLENPRANSGMKFFIEVEEFGDLSFLIKEMRDTVISFFFFIYIYLRLSSRLK
jgi:hypothetical protein